MCDVRHVLFSTSCLSLFTSLFLCTPVIHLLIIPVHLSLFFPQSPSVCLFSFRVSVPVPPVPPASSAFVLCAPRLLVCFHFSWVVSLGFPLPAFYCLDWIGWLDFGWQLITEARLLFLLPKCLCVGFRVPVILRENTTRSVSNLVTKLCHLCTINHFYCIWCVGSESR